MAALVALAAVLVAVAGLGRWSWSSLGALQGGAEARMNSGLAELEAAHAALAGPALLDAGRLDVEAARLSKARADFSAAADTVRANRLLAFATALPGPAGGFLAPRANALLDAAEMGVEMADAGLAAVAAGRAFMDPAGDPGTARPTGAQLLAALPRAESELSSLVAHLDRAQALDQAIDLNVLSGAQRIQVRKAGAEIAAARQTAGALSALAGPLQEILGGNGVRQYLIEEMDPGELRAGGGYIGAYAVLVANHGTITLTGGGDTTPINKPYTWPGTSGFVEPPAALLESMGHGWTVGDSNHSLSFAASARTGETLFHQRTGIAVDGVIALDAWAVAELLKITGPIQVPGYGITARSENFPEYYFDREEAINETLPGQRKDLLTATAKVILDTLSRLPAARWQSLLDAMDRASASRHLQLYFNAAAPEQLVTSRGWTGPAIPASGAGETLMELEDNLGATKADHWLQRSYQLVLTPEHGTLVHRLTITWRNQAPPGFLGGQHYTAYVRLYVPADAGGREVTGLDPADSTAGDAVAGLGLLAGWLEMAPWASATATFQWTTPLAGTSTTINWLKQPGTGADPVRVTLATAPAAEGTWTLGQDLHLAIGAGSLRGW